MRPLPVLTAVAFALAAPLGLAACSSDTPTDLSGADLSTAGAYTEDADASETVTPPPAVPDAFATTYPGVGAVTWSMEDGRYEAEFMRDGTETSVLYDAAGRAGAVEATIPVAALPAAVAAAIARDHAGQTVSEAARIEEGGVTRYEAEITADGAETDYVYAADGTLVATTPAESD